MRMYIENRKWQGQGRDVGVQDYVSEVQERGMYHEDNQRWSIIIIIILVYLTAHQHISGHTAPINNLELQIHFRIKYGNIVQLKLTVDPTYELYKNSLCNKKEGLLLKYVLCFYSPSTIWYV